MSDGERKGRFTIPHEELMYPGHSACPGCGELHSDAHAAQGAGAEDGDQHPGRLLRRHTWSVASILAPGADDRPYLRMHRRHLFRHTRRAGRQRARRCDGGRLGRGRRHGGHRTAVVVRGRRQGHRLPVRDVRQRGIHEHRGAVFGGHPVRCVDDHHARRQGDGMPQGERNASSR